MEVAPRSQHIFEERDSLEEMHQDEELPHFIDEEDVEMSGSEGLREQGSLSASDSDSVLPDADNDIRSQSTIGLNLEIVLDIDPGDMRADLLEIS